MLSALQTSDPKKGRLGRRSKQLERELLASKRELERHERNWQTHLKVAARIHESLLPHPVRHPRIDIEIRYIPLEVVGGDYCQVLFPDEGYCYITMCDVTGHGIEAALLAARVSSEVRHLAFDRLRPREIVQRLNSFLFQHFRDTELFVSFCCAQFDFKLGTVTHSGAGHPGPMLIREGVGSIERFASQNLLVGVAEHCLSDRPEQVAKLNPGDRLLFFTDGLTETLGAHDELLGAAGLAALAASTHAGNVFELTDRFLERVAAFRAGPMRDDMTLIVAELK